MIAVYIEHNRVKHNSIVKNIFMINNYEMNETSTSGVIPTMFSVLRMA